MVVNFISILLNLVVFLLRFADSMPGKWFKSFSILRKKESHIEISNLKTFSLIQTSTSKCQTSVLLEIPKENMVISCYILVSELKAIDLPRWKKENTTGYNLTCLQLELFFS